jgi:hypothetical protein
MYTLQIADSLADASTEKAEEPAPEDYPASDRCSVTSAVVCTEGRSNSEANCSADQNMPSVAMIRPLPLVRRPGISTLRWKRTPWFATMNLR